MRFPALAWLVIAFVGLAEVSPASAQVRLFADEFDRADVITIEQDNRDLFGFDSITGRRASFRLESGEAVHFLEARGRVGLVLTNRRAVAIGPGTGFRDIRFQVSEAAPEIGLVEDQIALVVTDKRVLGFVGTSGDWIEEDMSPSESPEAIRAGTSVAVVATNRRALGLGTNLNSFVETDFRVREVIESVSVQDTLATLRTDKRILVFGSLRAAWTIQDRSLR
jgi:hypothetical protein